MPTPIVLDLEENERIIYEIKRHPIRLIPMFAVAIVAIISLLLLMFMILSNEVSLINVSDLPFGQFALYLSFAVMVALVFVFTLILASVDMANELVVTNENIVQVLQYTPFNRKVSHLNLAKIQDVSIRQKGVLPSLFNYGSISIETAGEAANFYFRFAINPTVAGKIIVEAQEQYVKTRHNNPAN